MKIDEIIQKGWEINTEPTKIEIEQNVVDLCEYPVGELLTLDVVPGIVGGNTSLGVAKLMTYAQIAYSLGISTVTRHKGQSEESLLEGVKVIKAQERLLSLILFSQGMYRYFLKRAKEDIGESVTAINLTTILTTLDYVIVEEKPIMFVDLPPTDRQFEFHITTKRDIRRREQPC